MSNNINFHIYAGSLRGAIAYTECEKKIKPKYELKEMDGEITALEWGQSKDEILIGNKSGVVKIYNTGISKYINHIKKLDGTGEVVGLGLIDKKLIIGRLDGTINLYNRVKKKYDYFQTSVNTDSTMNAMVYNEQRNVIATGGENNDIKIWDINTQKNVFKAKSLGKDELELPIPTSVRGISFSSDEKIVTCITKEGMMLLYDEKSQRKPVQKYQEKNASFTYIAFYRDRQFFVGTTKGYLQLIDMRQGKCLKTFQPFAGSVTGIACDHTHPYVVTTSLDKHLRIHNVDTKEVLYKEYMKIGLTKILLRPVAKQEPEDEAYEVLFEAMETINDSNITENMNPPQKILKALRQ